MSEICVVGLGYIGLPTASLLAFNGYRVTGVDTNLSILEKLKIGNVHIDEPNLNIILKHVVTNKKLIFKTEPEAAEAFFIAVPTPFNNDKSCDLSYVLKAVNSIIPHLQGRQYCNP